MYILANSGQDRHELIISRDVSYQTSVQPEITNICINIGISACFFPGSSEFDFHWRRIF